MGKTISEDGRVIQGKYEGCYVYLWRTNESLSIHNGRVYEAGWLTVSNKQSSKVYIINKDSITDTQDMGSTVQKANPDAVMKIGFWFGAVAAMAADQIGTSEIHTVAVEYPDGERSLLQLNSHAYQTFKSIEFGVNGNKKFNQNNKSTDSFVQISTEPPKIDVEKKEIKRKILINADNIHASLKRAFLFLEDEEWETADEYFESILDIDPECGEAYLGELLIELKLPNREDLGNLEEFPADSKWYKRAIRFGSDELLDELQGYKDKIKHKAEAEKRLAEQKAEEEKQIAQQKIQEERQQEEKELEPYKPFVILSKEEQLFQLAAKQVEKNRLYSFYKAKYLFESLNHYKDSEQRANQCKNAIDKNRRARQADDNALREAKECFRKTKLLSSAFTDSEIELIYNNGLESETNQIAEQKSKLENELNSLGLFKNKRKKEIQNELAALTTEFEKLKDLKTRFQKFYNTPDSDTATKLEELYQYGISMLNKNQPIAAHFVFCNLADYKESKAMRCKSAEMIMKLYDLDDLNRIVTVIGQNIVVAAKNEVYCVGKNPFVNTDFSTWTNIHKIDCDSESKSVVGYRLDGTVVAEGKINDMYRLSILENVDNVTSSGYPKEHLSISRWNPYMSFDLQRDHTRKISYQRYCSALEKTITQYFNKIEIYGLLYKETIDFFIGDNRYLLGLNDYGKVDVFAHTEFWSENKEIYQPITNLRINENCDFRSWNNIKTISDGRTYDDQGKIFFYCMGIKQNGSVIATGRLPFDRNEICNWTKIKQIYITAAGGAVGVSETGKLYYTKDAFGEFTKILNEFNDYDFSGYKRLEIVYDLDIAYLLCITRDNQLIGVFAEKFDETTKYHSIKCDDIISFETAYYYSVYDNDDSIIAVKSDGSLCYAFKPLHSNIEGVEKIKLF